MTLTVGDKASFTRVFTQTDYDRFAVLIRDNNPTHVDPEFAAKTRYKKTVAHGMMLYSNLSRVLSTQLPGAGILQIKQDLMFSVPTYTGDEIEFEVEVLGVSGVQSMARLKTIAKTPNGSGAEGITHVCLPGWQHGFPGKDDSLWPQIKSESDQLKGMKLGQIATASREFSNADLDDYVDITGDDNRLYTDDAYARECGFQQRIIPGPLLSGMFSSLLGTELPGRGTNWLKQKIHFPEPAYPGEEITASVEIYRIRADKELINLRDVCTTASGKIVCQAESLTLAKEMA